MWRRYKWGLTHHSKGTVRGNPACLQEREVEFACVFLCCIPRSIGLHIMKHRVSREINKNFFNALTLRPSWRIHFIPEFWLHGRLPSNSSVISFLSFLLIPLKLFFILALFYVYLLLEQCGCDMYGCHVPWGEDWRLLLTACFTEAGFFCCFCCWITRTRPAGPQTSENVLCPLLTMP